MTTSHVKPAPPDPDEAAAPPDAIGTLTGSVILDNAAGLHARPAVKLTQTAKRFSATVDIALSADGPWIDAKSPVKVMRLKAARGAALHIRANGDDAAEAVASLVALAESHFGEEG